MDKNSTQQEIMLMVGTSFSSRQWMQKDETDEHRQLSEMEQLEEACWNGMIREMIPEICERDEDGNALLLWEVHEGNTFITLDMGEIPEDKDEYYSIDPYTFYENLSYN
ncbi:MAG: hypothetical protein C5B52_13560 [Bacteroidetes bacterium]|nr:MAG: hypothetical protein C5B52_13560 [Bacteroidota bacterium]